MVPVSTTWICIRYVLDSGVNAHVEFKDKHFYSDTYIFQAYAYLFKLSQQGAL